MADRFEQSIKEWYNTSRTANLEYRDLAENPKTKDYLLTITNNTSVIFDRLSLFSKVSLKHFYEIKNQIKKQEEAIPGYKRQFLIKTRGSPC